ncbi:MAG: tetratricopeptide repeat protein [Fidelibacterota bacterium]
MFKARKKITRREIQKDPFLEGLYSIKMFFSNNKQKIIQLSIGIVLGVIVVTYIYNKKLTQNQAAETALGKALVSLTKGDKDDGRLKLELLVDDFSGSKPAQKGLFLLGKNYYEIEDYLTAKSYLNEFIEDPSDEFHASALTLLAEIEKNNSNIESAAEYYQRAISASTTNFQKIQTQLNLAKFYLEIGKYKESKLLLDSILKHGDVDKNVQNKIDEITGRLSQVNSDE